MKLMKTWKNVITPKPFSFNLNNNTYINHIFIWAIPKCLTIAKKMKLFLSLCQRRQTTKTCLKPLYKGNVFMSKIIDRKYIVQYCPIQKEADTELFLLLFRKCLLATCDNLWLSCDKVFKNICHRLSLSERCYCPNCH